ncbi:hypothetical protein AAMO2058_000730200 [Amorphochlora amoebiformis]
MIQFLSLAILFSVFVRPKPTATVFRCRQAVQRRPIVPSFPRGKRPVNRRTAARASSGRESDGQISRAAYIHVPFCRRRCFYCDFAISVVGDSRSKWESEHEGYLQALLAEIETTPSEWGSCLTSVFFGGGTPSLASPSFIKKVIEALDKRYGLAKHAEISMEMDPGTFDLEKLRGFLHAGVNRVSLGVQTFDPNLLKEIGRAHSLEDVYHAIETLHAAGVDNFSIDLISGLPNQKVEDWRKSVLNAIRCNPTHISTYDLMVEQKTAFDRWGLTPGEPPLPSEAETLDMYRLTQKLLTREGYNHYEISNYAKEGYQCRHNRVYWEVKPFLAFGMGAASYTGDRRLTRPRKLGLYMEFVEAIKHLGLERALERYQDIDSKRDISRWEELTDHVMLGLRLLEGIDLELMRHKFGGDVVQHLLKGVAPAVDKNLAIIDRKELDSKPSRLRLHDPEGFLRSSDIISDIFAELPGLE